MLICVWYYFSSISILYINQVIFAVKNNNRNSKTRQTQSMKVLKKIISGIVNNATLMSWSAYFVQFGSGLLVLPLILTKYDQTDQAFWFLIGTIRGFAYLAETGLGFIIIRAVSYFFSGMKKLPKNLQEFDATDNDQNQPPNFVGLSNLLSTIKVIYIFLSTIVLILVSTLGIATVRNLFDIAGNPPHLWWSYIFVALSTVLYMETIKWQNYMNGLNFVAKVYRFGTFTGILRITVFSVMLFMDLGIEYLSFYILLDTVWTWMYYRWFVNNWLKKNYKKCGEVKFFKDIFLSIWPITWKTGITQWGEYFLSNGTSILAAQMQNVGLMTSFLFTKRVFELVRRTSEAPFYTHIPIIYRLMAVKDYSQLRKKASVYIFFSMVLLIGTTLILGLFGNHILGFVGIDTTFIPTVLFIVFTTTLLIEVHAGFHANIYMSTNHIPYMFPMLISGGVLMGVGYFILEPYGLLGLLLAHQVIWLVFMGWYQVRISLNLLTWKPSVYFVDVFRNGFAYTISLASNLKSFVKK